MLNANQQNEKTTELLMHLMCFDDDSDDKKKKINEKYQRLKRSTLTSGDAIKKNDPINAKRKPSTDIPTAIIALKYILIRVFSLFFYFFISQHIMTSTIMIMSLIRTAPE